MRYSVEHAPRGVFAIVVLDLVVDIQGQEARVGKGHNLGPFSLVSLYITLNNHIGRNSKASVIAHALPHCRSSTGISWLPSCVASWGWRIVALSAA